MQSVRITSKKQITIPSRIYKSLNLQQGDNLIVQQQGDALLLTPARQLVEQLAGSVPIPEKYKGKEIATIISEARAEYFAKHAE